MQVWWRKSRFVCLCFPLSSIALHMLQVKCIPPGKRGRRGPEGRRGGAKEAPRGSKIDVEQVLSLQQQPRIASHRSRSGWRDPLGPSISTTIEKQQRLENMMSRVARSGNSGNQQKRAASHDNSLSHLLFWAFSWIPIMTLRLADVRFVENLEQRSIRKLGR